MIRCPHWGRSLANQAPNKESHLIHPNQELPGSALSGQVNMLMDLCVTFISCNSDPESLAQRFEATVKSTLSHTDVKLMAQEFLDGELDIVNQVRLNVISALPKAIQREELPVLLAASTINTDADKAAHAKSRASHALEALTVEWMEKASELETTRLPSLSTTPPDTA
jgi:hypothetical protein